MADPFRLERILINLMDNAIKYSPEGGDVIISTRVENNELIVGVQDFGLGISAENQPKLFQSFERLGVSIPGGIQGIGLGLRVSKALVEAHNGRMWLESEPGKGSTFYFSLPIA
jgi:signal transduction histidine kinase